MGGRACGRSAEPVMTPRKWLPGVLHMLWYQFCTGPEPKRVLIEWLEDEKWQVQNS